MNFARGTKLSVVAVGDKILTPHVSPRCGQVTAVQDDAIEVFWERCGRTGGFTAWYAVHPLETGYRLRQRWREGGALGEPTAWRWFDVVVGEAGA